MQISLHARAAVRRQRSSELVHAAAHAAGGTNVDSIAAATIGRHIVMCMMRRVRLQMAAISVVWAIVKCAANSSIIGINAGHVIAIVVISRTVNAGGIGSRQNMRGGHCV